VKSLGWDQLRRANYYAEQLPRDLNLPEILSLQNCHFEQLFSKHLSLNDHLGSPKNAKPAQSDIGQCWSLHIDACAALNAADGRSRF